MTPDDLDALLAELESGATLRVPLQTTLFPDTQVDHSTLRADPTVPGRFVLRTYFHEYAPGHGWSCEQTEEEVLERDVVRTRLAGEERAACTPVDR